MPSGTLGIVFSNVLPANVGKEMVVAPFGDRAHPSCSEQLAACISNMPVVAGGQGQPEATAGINDEGVGARQANNEPWPLRWDDRDGPVGFSNLSKWAAADAWQI
jgi:hypothetical protein